MNIYVTWEWVGGGGGIGLLYIPYDTVYSRKLSFCLCLVLYSKS